MFDITLGAQNTAIVRVQGKIIGNTVTQFRKEMEQQVRNGNHKLIIDLKQVPLVDSTALGVIILTMQVLQESDGKLVLLDPQEAVSNILEVTRLATILEVYDTEADAQNAF